VARENEPEYDGSGTSNSNNSILQHNEIAARLMRLFRLSSTGPAIEQASMARRTFHSDRYDAEIFENPQAPGLSKSNATPMAVSESSRPVFVYAAICNWKESTFSKRTLL
jgi:hypothetical protein